MDYRRRKQLKIISLLVIFFIILGIIFYFKYFRQAASCFDGKQNQNETGVDCGGVCISCERLTTQNLKIDWVRIIPLRNNHYDLVAEISNPNPNFGLESFDYTFKLKDSSGTVVATKSDNSFILPGQKKYLIEANYVAEKEITEAELFLPDIDKNSWQELSPDFDPRVANLFVKDRQFQYLENGTAFAQASGVIKNSSNFDFERVIVSVVLFDGKRDVIGVNKTEARTIPAGSERYFSVLWFEPLPGDVKFLDMVAETNLFADDNFMKHFGEPEKFQQY